MAVNQSDLVKQIKKRRTRKIIFLAAGIILTLFLVFLVLGFVLYYWQVKPTAEKVQAAEKLVSFLDYYEKEVTRKEFTTVQDKMKRDDELYAKLTNKEYKNKKEYQEIIKARVKIYEESQTVLKDARKKITGYPSSEHVKNVQEILLVSIDKRIEAYTDYLKGFNDLLAEKDGDVNFKAAEQKLNEANDFEKKASDEAEKEIKNIFGEKLFEQMKSSGQIKEKT